MVMSVDNTMHRPVAILAYLPWALFHKELRLVVSLIYHTIVPLRSNLKWMVSLYEDWQSICWEEQNYVQEAICMDQAWELVIGTIDQKKKRLGVRAYEKGINYWVDLTLRAIIET